MAALGGPQAMEQEEASRPVHDHVQAARTSFLAIVRGLEKSGHILLGLLVAATAAGCWTGLYWLTESAPAMAASVVVTLLYTLLHLLDQKQAAALTCLGGWVLVNTLLLALTFSLSSDVLAQKQEVMEAPLMLAAYAAAFWCAGIGLSVQPLAMRTRLISGIAGAGLHVAASAVAYHRLEGQVHKVSTVLVTRLLALAWGAICVHVVRRHGGRFHAVVRGLQQLGEQLKELDGELQAQATAAATSPTARRSKTPPFAVSEECEVATATPPPLTPPPPMPSARVDLREERDVSALAAWLGGAVYLYLIYFNFRDCQSTSLL